MGNMKIIQNGHETAEGSRSGIDAGLTNPNILADPRGRPADATMTDPPISDNASTDKDFPPWQSNDIQGSKSFQVCKKLRMLQGPLKELNRKSFEGIDRKEIQIKADLEQINS
ncbi:hypothetical protein RIF29_08489 [Crotalaria pallida]|uniref:Uncharacterized protein n=1 Tax=Crotalaria pallida TaxID=3830 RepID=A0AAN9ILJ2_CROPI